MISEKQGFSINGYVAFFLLLPAVQFTTGYFFLNGTLQIVMAILFLLALVCWAGFFMVQPNQGKVMTLFGSYVGTEKRTGLRWTIPFL